MDPLSPEQRRFVDGWIRQASDPAYRRTSSVMGKDAHEACALSMLIERLCREHMAMQAVVQTARKIKRQMEPITRRSAGGLGTDCYSIPLQTGAGLGKVLEDLDRVMKEVPDEATG